VTETVDARLGRASSTRGRGSGTMRLSAAVTSRRAGCCRSVGPRSTRSGLV